MRALAERAAPERPGPIAVAGSALLHGFAIVALVLASRDTARHSPLPAYRVELIAAPRASGEPNAADGSRPTADGGPEAQAAPEPGTRPAATGGRTAPQPARSPPARQVPAEPSAASREPAPRPPVQPSAVSRQPSAVAPGAPGARPVASPNTGAAPGMGTAPATIRTEGVEFPFPGYLRNLVAQVYRRWHPPSGNADLEAEMLFFVHRDGSITGLQFVRRSGSFGFDLEAQGAVEAAARAGAFGPLPQGFGPDLLPVSFFFSPRSLR